MPQPVPDIRSAAVRALLAKPVSPVIRWVNLCIFLIIIASSVLLFRWKVTRYLDIPGRRVAAGIEASVGLPQGVSLQTGQPVGLLISRPNASTEEIKGILVSVTPAPGAAPGRFVIVATANRLPSEDEGVRLKIAAGKRPFLKNIFQR
ncbi:MAG TPA: hypothetical protein VL727_07330 [Puia sp.]|jgi:hypothetical protein|nr:hypothetical protein [Puia sp.]